MIGQIISHYKITAKLGEGGMGEVYLAEDTKLRRQVALKFLSPQALDTPEAKTRFVHEARAAASLDHPNICAVHEIDETDGHTFIAMAYVDGQSLKDKIETGPLSLDEALSLAIDIAKGLQEAHEKNIVHRDIKSANVMISRKGHGKITDFGLAKLAGGTRVTKTGTMLGTAAYMSPEQVSGETADHRSDIWSLGVILHEMLTGRLPFVGDQAQAVAYQIVHEDAESLTAIRTGVPMELERIVGKCLAKNPSNRYQHVDDLLVDLRNIDEAPVAGKFGKNIFRYLLPVSVALLVIVLFAVLRRGVRCLGVAGRNRTCLQSHKGTGGRCAFGGVAKRRIRRRRVGNLAQR
jgi:serine/threonine protein kinase